ncbi:MAG: hypothetical protein LBG21_05270 [Campylobacteraceae bacterium]|jgi:hypothetical protein|nr:hypothetical protein [Campylobacteraceae bacterium]
MNGNTSVLKINSSTLFYKSVFIFIVMYLFVNIGKASADIEDMADSKLNFDCNSLYYVQDDSDVFKVYNLVPGVQTTITSKKQYNLDVKSEYGGFSGRHPDTIALGPNSNGVLTMYQWDYVTFTREIDYVHKNQASKIAKAFSFPEFVNFRGWSGGEVNQKTGEIYFVGYNQNELGDEARMMIYDPSTRKISKSGILKPESSWETNFEKYKVQSDMAIDADGNAYIMVSKNTDYYLLRVVPDKKNPNNWRYNEVNHFVLDSDAEIWGMSFLNGMLYVNSNFYIYELNPLTGAWRNTNFLARNSFDFTACQMAPVIKGKVYFDANGDSILSKSEREADGVRNIEIQVYDKNKMHLGSQYTNGKGEYNFLLPSAKSTFYIRLKRPKINGMNAYQTWASGGNYEWKGSDNKGANIVVPSCHNNITIPNVNYYEKNCYGAREDGIDHSSNSIKLANFYSQIVMQTDRAVVHADFALAPSDRGDAPSSFGEVSHAVNSNAHLGSKIDADTYSKTSPKADKDNFDDGVQVRLENNTSWSNLQGFLFANSQKYNFRVKVKSDNGQKGFLNAWIALNSTTFSEKIASDLQDDNNAGYIEFNYTTPERIILNADNTTKAFYRFRYSTNKVSNILSYNPHIRSLNNYPWAIDGEVEDYMSIYQYKPKPKYLKGNFLVVNQNFNIRAGEQIDTKSHHQTALYTQIAGKKFSVKLIHHENSKISKDIGGNVNATIDFVEYNTKVPDCNNVKILKKNVNTLKIKPTQTIIPFDITLHNATDRGTFKITYQLSDSPITNATCSDIFVVRPKEFILSNDFGANLIGGKSNNGSIKALQSNGDISINYHQQAVNIAHVNSTLIKPLDCELDTNASNEVMITPYDIKNGIGNLTINYQNIGDVNVIISDKSWALNDKIYNDCLDILTNEHNQNGKVGCDIAIKTNLKFIPKAFKSTLGVSDFADKYTYISSDPLMHAYINMEISAILDNNLTAVNYNKNCFAKDVEYNIQFNDNNITDWNNREGESAKKRIMYVEKTGAKIIPSNKNSDGEVKLKTAQNNFINGTAHTNIGFNFERPSNPEKPFIIKFNDFNITNLKNTDNIKGLVYDGNGDAHMYYGRAHSKEPEYKVFDQDSVNADIYYEVYCPMYCNRSIYGTVQISNMDMQYKDWYINSAHAINQGNITKFQITQGLADLSKSMSDKTPKYYTDIIRNGIETLGVNKKSTQTPHSVTITFRSSSWLLHDPAFKVTFLGDGGKWAGHGQVNKTDKIGKILDVNGSKYTGQKIDW